MMRHDQLFYHGKSSSDFEMLILEADTTASPQRDVEFISIPGRLGDLVIDRGRYQNVGIKYTAAIIDNFEQNFVALKSFLLEAKGYHRLQDTIHPNEYRLATFVGPIRPNTAPYNYAGTFVLEFTCKPQRFQTCGEIQLSYFEPGLLNNLYRFAALPLIKVYGSGAGTLTVGQRVVEIKALDEWVMLDSDTQNAYKGTINKNGSIYAPEFPTLEPGENVIAWSGGIEKVEITPRWWTL